MRAMAPDEKRTKRKSVLILAVVVGGVAVVAGRAVPAQDKYAARLPGGVAFSDFKGYEGWQLVSVSQTEDRLKVILANPTMIDAFKAGIATNGASASRLIR